MFSKITVLGRPGLAISTRVSASEVIVGGRIKPPIRRQTIYLLCEMIFALAYNFSNSFSQPKKKERAELGFEPRTSYNLGIKAQSKNWPTLAS
jgi:hypothetical protein